MNKKEGTVKVGGKGHRRVQCKSLMGPLRGRMSVIRITKTLRGVVREPEAISAAEERRTDGRMGGNIVVRSLQVQFFVYVPYNTCRLLTRFFFKSS